MAMVGTLVHEAGHILVAEGLGYPATLHYGWMNHAPAPERHAVWILLGGPGMNMGIGTLGALLLAVWVRRGRQRLWVGAMAFLATLFWSRQLFNAVMWTAAGAGTAQGDEVRLAALLGVNLGAFLVPTGVVATGFCGWACVGLVGWRRSPGLAVGGVMGSLLGFAGWYGWLGPVVLP